MTSVGDYRWAHVDVAAAVNLPDATNVDILTLTLDPGDWDVAGSIYFQGTSSAGAVTLRAWLNNLPLTQPDGMSGGLAIQSTASAGLVNEVPIGVTRAIGTQATIIYLGAYADFTSGSMKAAGYIRARRMA
jgi:hypothetical protein